MRFSCFASNTFENTLFREHFCVASCLKDELCLVHSAQAVGGFKAIIVLSKKD